MPAAALQHARQSLDWTLAPVELIEAWPTDVPLICLVSGGAGEPRSRWSIFSTPTGFVRHPAPGVAVWTTLQGSSDQPSEFLSGDVLADLDACARATARRDPPTSENGPFQGGWIGWLSYDAGRLIEPAAEAGARVHPSRRRTTRAIDDRAWPLMELYRCPGAYVHDAAEGRWLIVGDSRALPKIEPPRARVFGGTFDAAPPHSRTGQPAFEGAVLRAIEYIRAGDIFQVNLAHRLETGFEGSVRALASSLLARSGAWYGGLIESPGRPGGLSRALCSASPELFLDVDLASRRIVTRPMKGTMPARAGGARHALEVSVKDRAELTMIVDLMRNDLGRVCEFGSIRVEDERAIELHGGAGETGAGVYQGVATVSGMIREGLSIADVLRATFPAGSITGAPKVRAMQIIDALEPVRRGPYCGSMFFVSDHGRAMFNVAIRTAGLTLDAGSRANDARGLLDYSVGAGIVADSEPEREWRETMEKAGVLLGTLDAAAIPASAGGS